MRLLSYIIKYSFKESDIGINLLTLFFPLHIVMIPLFKSTLSTFNFNASPSRSPQQYKTLNNAGNIK